MPIRFRRTLNILPGVRVNVSKHGVSTTVGPRGMHLTFNRYGVRQDLGLPGTGLSENSYLIRSKASSEEEARRHIEQIHHGQGLGCHMPGCGCLLLLLLVAGAAVYFAASSSTVHAGSLLTALLNGLPH